MGRIKSYYAELLGHEALANEVAENYPAQKKPKKKEVPWEEQCAFCSSRATRNTGSDKVCFWHYAERVS